MRGSKGKNARKFSDQTAALFLSSNFSQETASGQLDKVTFFELLWISAVSLYPKSVQ
jgi:hypothetical protein